MIIGFRPVEARREGGYSGCPFPADGQDRAVGAVVASQGHFTRHVVVIPREMHKILTKICNVYRFRHVGRVLFACKLQRENNGIPAGPKRQSERAPEGLTQQGVGQARGRGRGRRFVAARIHARRLTGRRGQHGRPKMGSTARGGLRSSPTGSTAIQRP